MDALDAKSELIELATAVLEFNELSTAYDRLLRTPYGGHEHVLETNAAMNQLHARRDEMLGARQESACQGCVPAPTLKKDSAESGIQMGERVSAN